MRNKNSLIWIVTTIQGQFISKKAKKSCLKIQQWFIICMASCRKDIEKSAKYYFATCERCKTHLQIRIWLLFLVEVETSFTHHMISKKSRAPHFYLILKLFVTRRVSSTLRVFYATKKLRPSLYSLRKSKWIITFTFPSSFTCFPCQSWLCRDICFLMPFCGMSLIDFCTIWHFVKYEVQRR